MANSKSRTHGPVLFIEVTADLKARLREFAKARGLSDASAARMLILEGMARREDQPRGFPHQHQGGSENGA